MQQSSLILWQLLHQLFTLTTQYCRRYKGEHDLGEEGDIDIPAPNSTPILDEDPLELCKKGNLVELQKYTDYNLNEGMMIAVSNNRREVVEYLLEQGATDLDNALTLSCVNNLYDISELLVKKGAKTIYGLRVSKSPNITRMLYRYEQGSENII